MANERCEVICALQSPKSRDKEGKGMPDVCVQRCLCKWTLPKLPASAAHVHAAKEAKGR